MMGVWQGERYGMAGRRQPSFTFAFHASLLVGATHIQGGVSLFSNSMMYNCAKPSDGLIQSSYSHDSATSIYEYIRLCRDI